MSGTKQRILDTSLMLFSQRGFSAVSIRDICAEVGIKESSVYYHFKNKEAILDELVRRFVDTASGMMSCLDGAISDAPCAIQGDFYSGVCNAFFENYLMDDFCNKVMRLLMIERTSNPAIQELYDEWMFRKPLAFQSQIFGFLVQSGIIRQADPTYLAMKYYGPIYLLAQRWLLCGPLSEDNKNVFRAEVYPYIQSFFAELEVN